MIAQRTKRFNHDSIYRMEKSGTADSKITTRIPCPDRNFKSPVAYSIPGVKRPLDPNFYSDRKSFYKAIITGKASAASVSEVFAKKK